MCSLQNVFSLECVLLELQEIQAVSYFFRFYFYDAYVQETVTVALPRRLWPAGQYLLEVDFVANETGFGSTASSRGQVRGAQRLSVDLFCHFVGLFCLFYWRVRGRMKGGLLPWNGFSFC